MNFFCPLSLSVNFTMKMHNVYRDTLHTSKEKLQVNKSFNPQKIIIFIQIIPTYKTTLTL